MDVLNPTAQLLAARAAYKAKLNELWFTDAFGLPQHNGWFHDELFELCEKHPWVLIEAPREHGKTQAAAITLPLIELKLNRNARILLVSDVHDKSAERARVLRAHIETNEAYRSVSPEVRIIRKNGDYEFTVARDIIVKEPSVRSTYSHAPIAGGRYDLIVMDDFASWLYNSNTPGKRDKLHRWIMDEVTNSIAPGGRVVVIGTRQHYDDEYERLKADARFRAVAFPALDEDGALGYRERNEARGFTGDDATCLWPEMHDYSSLIAKREADESSFMRQQMLVAVPESGLVYRKALMDAAFELGKDVSYNPRATQFVGYDPGYAIRGAMLCIQETTGDRMEMWAEHSFTQVAPDDIASFIARHCLNHNVLVAFVDAADLGFRLALEQKLSSIGATTRVQKVPFGEFKTHAIQTTRWLLKSGLIAWKGESTTVHTPGRTRTEPSIFRREMLSYALKEGTDDEAVKADDHGPDAWVAYTSRWIRYYLRAMGEEAA